MLVTWAGMLSTCPVVSAAEPESPLASAIRYQSELSPQSLEATEARLQT